MKLKIHTLSYDDDGTGCLVFATEAELHAAMKYRIERHMTSGRDPIAEHSVRASLALGEIQAAWNEWNIFLRNPQLTYEIEVHEIEVPDKQVPMHTFLVEEGGHAKQELPCVHYAGSVHSDGAYANGAGVHLDWYNDRLQLCVDDGLVDDPALHVRFNEDGSIAEVLVRDCGIPIKHESGETTAWQLERDRETKTP